MGVEGGVNGTLKYGENGEMSKKGWETLAYSLKYLPEI